MAKMTTPLSRARFLETDGEVSDCGGNAGETGADRFMLFRANAVSGNLSKDLGTGRRTRPG
jgi:hypothetical protein